LCGGGFPPRQRLPDIRHCFELWGDVGRQALWCLRCALALSFSRSRLWAQDAGQAEKAREMKANGQVSPNSPPLLAFISPRRADTPPRPESATFNVVDLAIADGWVP